MISSENTAAVVDTNATMLMTVKTAATAFRTTVRTLVEGD
jgi:hypothetical protein